MEEIGPVPIPGHHFQGEGKSLQFVVMCMIAQINRKAKDSNV